MNNIDIDVLIKDAMKNKDNRLEIFREIKKNFTDWKTSEDGSKIYKENGNVITTDIQQKILTKMVKSCTKAKAEFVAANRTDLADAEQFEIDVLSEFLPKQASEADVISFLDTLNLEKSPKSMGAAMKEIRVKFPTLDGKVASAIVKKYLSE